MTNKISFTDNELKNITINAMGRASEAGGLPVHQLGMAANVSGGVVQHTKDNNSGYSLGFFQHDFGGKRVSARGLVDAYNDWEDKPKALSNGVADRLYQNRDIVNSLKVSNPNAVMKDIRLEEDGKNINAFLASPAGYEYTMQLQEQQYDVLLPYINRALNSPSVQNMSKEESVYVLATVAKIANQAGTGDKTLSNVLSKLDDKNNMLSFEDYKSTVVSHPKLHVRSGVVATGHGADLYNLLVNEKSQVGEIFRDQITKDPFSSEQNVRLSPQDQLMDTVFRYSEESNLADAHDLLKAINENKDYVLRPTFFSNNLNKTNALAAEVYSVGVKDGVLFTIDIDGNAHRMNDKGQWIAFNNNENPFVHRDINNRWTTSPKDLVLGSKGYHVLELQEKLNALDPNGIQLATNGKDSVYDQATVDRIKAFQTANGIEPTSGTYDATTRAKIDEQLNEQNKHKPFVRSLGKAPNIDQQITDKFDEIEKLTAQLKDYDQVRDISEIAKAEADIEQARHELAQLELDRQQEIDRQQAKLAEDKESIVGELALATLKVGVLNELNDQLKGLSNSPEDINKAEGLVKESGLTLSTPAEIALAEKGTLDLTKSEDVTTLQNVLYERGLITSTTRGNFLSQTQGGLRNALGLPNDHQFGTSLSAEDVNKLTQLSTESIQSKVDAELTKAKDVETVLTEKSASTDSKIADLENRRPDIYEQKIADERQSITDRAATVAGIDSSLTSIQTLQIQLESHKDDTKPYAGIKEQVTDQSVFFSTQENAFYNNPTVLKQDPNLKVNEETRQVQNFLNAQKDAGGKSYLEGDKFNDGRFGGNTAKAIIAYKTANNITPATGEIDKELRLAMREEALQEKSYDDLSQSLEANRLQLVENQKEAVENQKSADQQSHDQIYERQGQQIQHIQDQIAIKEQAQTEIQKEIDLNAQQIKDTGALQGSLYSREDIDPDKPIYSQVKADIEKAGIELSLGAEKDAFYASINTKDKTQAAALQDYLIEQKYLDPTYKNKAGVEKDSNDGDFGGRSVVALDKALEESGVPKPYIDDKGAISKEALEALKGKELDGLTKDELVTKIDEYKTALTSKNKALSIEKEAIGTDIAVLENKVTDKVATHEAQKDMPQREQVEPTKEAELERASIKLMDPTNSSVVMEGNRPILMVAGQSFDLSEFNAVKGMNVFRSPDQSLMGRINDEGGFEVFQKIHPNSVAKLAEIENVKEQNLVKLSELSPSRSRDLDQTRDQDQGRSIG